MLNIVSSKNRPSTSSGRFLDVCRGAEDRTPATSTPCPYTTTILHPAKLFPLSQRLNALGASQDFFAGELFKVFALNTNRNLNPLQVGLFSFFDRPVIFPPQLL